MTEKQISEYNAYMPLIKCLRCETEYLTGRSEKLREASAELSEQYRLEAEKLTAKMRELEDHKRAVDAFIDSVTDESVRRMIVMRYIRGFDWVRVSGEFDFIYSADYCRVTVKRYLKKHDIK